MSNCIATDDDLTETFEAAATKYNKLTKGAWPLFFIDGLAYQADWLGLLHPDLTAAYLLALADLITSSTNREDYERAQKIFDVRRRELLEAFEDAKKNKKERRTQ